MKRLLGSFKADVCRFVSMVCVSSYDMDKVSLWGDHTKDCAHTMSELFFCQMTRGHTFICANSGSAQYRYI